MSDLPPPPGSPFPPPPPSIGSYPPPPPGYGAPPGYSTTYGAPGPTMEYANLWARFGALLIDGVIAGVMIIPAIVAIIAGPTEIRTCSVDDDGNVTVGGEINAWCEVPTGGTWAMFAVLMVLGFIGVVLYHTLMVGRSGQTLGKRACGVRVVDATTGQAIGNGRALGRYLFSAFISGNVCALGFFWAVWDSRKQTWHDKVVSSVVVKA